MIASAKNSSSKLRAQRWKDYYEFKESCLLLTNIINRDGTTMFGRDLDYGFALTSHKSQGVKERFSDREGDDVHCSDTLQEIKSLSDRFGIQVTFQRPDKATYLHIVEQLAQEHGLALAPAQLHAEAERAALHRGGRSARLAKQVVEQLMRGS